MEMNYLRSCVPDDAESERAKKQLLPSPTSQHSQPDYQTATALFFPLVHKPSCSKDEKKGARPHLPNSRTAAICTFPEAGLA